MRHRPYKSGEWSQIVKSSFGCGFEVVFDAWVTDEVEWGQRHHVVTPFYMVSADFSSI
jgi:hypothetical protein